MLSPFCVSASQIGACRNPESFAADCRLGYFRFFVILGFFMIITASIIGIFLPLIESRHLIFQVLSTA